MGSSSPTESFPLNYIQIGSMARKNGHADRWQMDSRMKGHVKKKREKNNRKQKTWEYLTYFEENEKRPSRNVFFVPFPK